MTVIRIDPQQLQAEGLINADMTRLLEARALTESRFGLFVNLSLIMGALAVAAGAIALVVRTGRLAESPLGRPRIDGRTGARRLGWLAI